jgi:apolipoprotein N-acyltransferase
MKGVAASGKVLKRTCREDLGQAKEGPKKDKESIMPSSRLTVTDLLFLTFGAFLYTIASPPYEWTGAAWFALTPFFLVLQHKIPREAFFAGLLYGVLSCIGVASWVYFAIATYFSLPSPLDLLFTLISYGFFVGSYIGLAAALSCILIRSGKSFLCWGGIPALWVSGEFARSSLFSGFSWWLLGYTQYRHLPLIQISDITGVYGLSFLMALNSYVGAEILRFLHQRWQGREWKGRPPWLALGAITGGVALVLLYGALRLGHTSLASQVPVTVALVQGNVPSEHRWQQRHYASTLLTYISVTRRGLGDTPPDLIVWPEFALGFYLDREYLFQARLSQFIRRRKAFLLLGAPRMEESEGSRRYYNSAYFFSPDAKLLNVYDKIRLLPFAEYRVLTLPVLLPHSPEHPSDFTQGQRSTVFSLPQGAFGAMICYEATYPYLARRLVRSGAQFLVNISNDTWLVQGGQAAVVQHFAMAVFRAVENRRPLVRVATSGISGFVDVHGRPYHLSTAKEGVIRGKVFPRQELTLYTRYGDWFAWGCVSFVLMALLQAPPQPVGARSRP